MGRSRTGGAPRARSPEILEADLSSLVLTACFGEADPTRLLFSMRPRRLPSMKRVASGADWGRSTGLAADGAWPRGAAIPLDPGWEYADRSAGARVGAAGRRGRVLLTERGLGGNDADVEVHTGVAERAGSTGQARDGWQRGGRPSPLASRVAPLPLRREGGSGRDRPRFPEVCRVAAISTGEQWQSVGGRASARSHFTAGTQRVAGGREVAARRRAHAF